MTGENNTPSQQSRRDIHVTKMSMAHNNNNNVNVAGHGQQASTMRDVIRLFQEKEELELELKEAEELQLQLEEGLKDELESIEKEYEDKTTVMYREALDQVYAVSRQVAEKRREDGVEEAEHNQAIRTLEQNQVTLTKEKREKSMLIDEIKEDLRKIQKTMNNEREFRDSIDWLCEKYSGQPVADAADIMLDVEKDHQLFLFQQAYKMNRQMSAHISKEKYNFRDSCRDLIRQNYELLEERNREVDSMEKYIKDLHEDNMKLKSSLVETQRMVKEMVSELNAIDPYLKWDPFKSRRKSF